MRKRLLSVLGILAIATFAAQMAVAAPHSTRKAVRVPPPATHQFRDGFAAARRAENKSCDMFWCYEN
jgi:hypothetical protein